MATYPTSKETLATNRTNSDAVKDTHPQDHNDVNDVVNNLQDKVGIDGDGTTSSHDFKLSDVADGEKAVATSGDQTIDGNKTFNNDVTVGGTFDTTSPDLTTPNITTGIRDANGNEVLDTPATASAVNHIKTTNQTTGNDALIEAAGDDSNVGLRLKGQGTGQVKLGDAEISFPDTDGTNGQILETDGSGNLSFVSTAGLTVENSSGTSHSLTTDGSTTVMVWVKGEARLSGSGSNVVYTVDLDYDSTTKDSVTIQDDDASDKRIPFSLFYTELPANQTANITVSISGASGTFTINNVEIMVLKI